MLTPEAPPWLQREQSWYTRSQSAKDAVLQPIVKGLAWVRLQPSSLSYAGVVLMALFALVVSYSPITALCLLLVGLSLDLFDGALARATHHALDRGKFIDIACDTTAFIIFVVGVVTAGLVPSLWGIVVVAAMIGSVTLRMVINQTYFNTEWRFKPVAGLFPALLRTLSYFFYLPWAIFGLNVLAPGLMVFALLLSFDTVRFYRKLLYS